MATLFPLNLIYNQIAQKYKTNSAHNNEANYLFINGEEIDQETVFQASFESGGVPLSKHIFP